MRSAPTSLRETLELFRFYRPNIDIELMLQDTGVADMSPRQIYQSVHERPPDTLAIALPKSDYNATANFIAALSSHEFQLDLAAHILRAFPEKRRLFFVHIPKTAGVDVATRLISRFASINTNLLDRTLTPRPEELFLAIKHIIQEIAFSDTIFISGHTQLGTYQTWTGNGIRYQDEVFTVVREPMDRMISQVNYVLTRIFSDETPVPPDTAGWRKEFNVEDPNIRHSRDGIPQLARRILRHEGVVVPDIMCQFIGGSGLDAALTQTVAHNLEVVDLPRLDAWNAERWGARERTRLNRSEKFISVADFSAEDIDAARRKVQADLKYYDIVLQALERHGGNSIRGAQILS